jgi:hypothetical protein
VVLLGSHKPILHRLLLLLAGLLLREGLLLLLLLQGWAAGLLHPIPAYPWR